MGDTPQPIIFDGHNDLLLQLYQARDAQPLDAFLSGRDGHIDANKVSQGGFAGGMFAVFVPSEDWRSADMTAAQYDIPLPPPIAAPKALEVVMSQAAILFELEAAGALTVCRSVGEIRTAMAAGKLAAVFHIEGAEAIDPDLAALEVLYQAGFRSLGPVWSRPTLFAEGVPFRYPSDPDTGGGLTDAGTRLVQRCNALGIMIDLSHINAAGFWDIAKLSDKPLVATHSNAHAICPHARNLTDEQLRAIRDSDGMVGLNFAVAFLREDGRMLEDVPLTQILRHLDHLIGILGEDRVGLGSDFDGAVVPKELGSAAGLPALSAAMRRHGYDEDLMTKLCHGNWMRVLELTWGG